MMVNTHKKGGEKLSGNSGCYFLLSRVLCVLFYTEILPFFSSLLIFMVSVVYGSICTGRN